MNEMNDNLNEMIVYLEKVFERQLNVIEIDKLNIWLNNGIDYADITKAYAKMCVKCDKPVFNYMAAIIDNQNRSI